METNSQASTAARSGAVDYAAALRQYYRYGRGRSMKKFCKLEREGQIDQNTKAGEDRPVFVEVRPDGTVAQVVPEEPMKVCEIRIRISNGLVLSRRGGDVEISNNKSEQSVRKLKMNLRNDGNIGSESSAADNAFMYSVIESCKLKLKTLNDNS